MNQATVKNWQSRIGNKISRNKLRNKIIDIYRSEKGFKVISKPLVLWWTMMRVIIHKN